MWMQISLNVQAFLGGCPNYGPFFGSPMVLEIPGLFSSPYYMDIDHP